MIRQQTQGLLALLAISTPPVLADTPSAWELGLYYDRLSDIDVYDIDANVLSVAAGYKYVLKNKFSITPMFKIGTGLGGETLEENRVMLGFDDRTFEFDPSMDIEVDSFVEVSLRIEERADRFYVYVAPSYGYVSTSTRFHFEPVGNVDEAFLNTLNATEDRSSDEHEFGYGLGWGYYISPHVKFEMGYQRYGDTSVATAGVSYIWF